MEKGQPIWLRSTASHWGWVPALVHNKEEVIIKDVSVLRVTLRDDPRYNNDNNAVTVVSATNIFRDDVPRKSEIRSNDYGEIEPFELTLTIDLESFSRDELDNIKIRDDSTTNVGNVDDLIGLTHLHEPAILHALRVRYEEDVIYTSTGPILIAINPFKPMALYSEDVMEKYRLQGEGMLANSSSSSSGKNKEKNAELERRLPPHAYLTADDAYRAMMRGIEISATTSGNARKKTKRDNDENETPTNQSILVSGESGAGKTVTTKIVLNYFAMLSKLVAKQESADTTSATSSRVEQQVLDSNPILEAFGNARTLRNDNSSRFGKYIDIRFSSAGRLTGARIDTYLLEKVRLIRQTEGERNFHVFYQLLEAVTEEERDRLFLGEMQLEDFRLVNQSGTYDRRDLVEDKEMHREMLDAMATMGFDAQMIKNILRLIVAVLYAGNMTFTETTSLKGDTCTLDETEAAEAVACLLGVSFDKLAAALTSRVLFLKEEVIVKELSAKQAYKASEALIKSIYGANFDYIVKTINESIHNEKVDKRNDKSAYIGVLDIFGFETFEVNSFEQLCINYTNETLQQHFNKHVFKMEQQEYEREGILWKFISFPDNQDVLDLIDMKRTGILAILDELCIVEWGSDDKLTHALYTRCEKHDRFDATPQQQAIRKFSVEHYAGPVEYSTEEWIEKNKDQLPAASVELLQSSNFSLLNELQGFVRAEGAGGRGSVAMKSLSAKFSEQLKDLRKRIDLTDPHYIRCLKPNDDLLPDEFDPKNIVEQLRYSGVLEAVRVSRAGYPTRYPHALFLSRYYMLGDLGGDGNKRSKDIVELVKWIALHIWEHDNQRREAKAILDAKEAKSKVTASPNRQKKRMNAQSNIDIPETKEDFNKLDFGTQCAVAGLQLGRTKVFLRREAFDRIESLRAILYGKSACIIQAQIRGRVQRLRYFRLKVATAKTQAAIRYFLANLGLIRQRKKEARERWASSTIQLAYRRYRFRTLGADKRDEMLYSATIIQALARSFLVRLHLDDIMPDDVAKSGDLKEAKPQEVPAKIVHVIQSGPSVLEISLILAKKAEMFQFLLEGKWEAAIVLMDQHKQLAEQTEDETGRLPLHIVAEHNLHSVFDQVYTFYPKAANAFDNQGRLPIHVAAEKDALVPLRYLLSKNPEGADTMMLRPSGRIGGGIPLHIACRTNASSSVITALLSSNFNSTKKSDANGDLPVHLLLRNGGQVSGVVAQALLDIYPTAATRADMYGDLPLSVALKHQCKPEVVKVLLMHNPDAAKVQNGRDGHSPLFLAFQNHANDKTILGLMNHAPDLIVARDKRTNMLPIEMATENRHSKEIVYDLLRHDMPIDMKEKSVVKLIPHQHSWTHLVSQSNDYYHDVVSKVLQQCSQPQILALSQIQNESGEVALVTATPLCKHEFRVSFRLFHTLEVVDTTPAYTNEENAVQIFYALRYPPPPEKMGYFTTLFKDDKTSNNHVEPWDDLPAEVDDYAGELDFTDLDDIEEKLELIKNENGKKVIAKLTSRSDIVQAEMSKREDHQLSRHYVPAIISIHHTIQHAAYSEAMAEPSYCITMEGADTTAENLLLDLRRSGCSFAKEHLKSIAIAILHIHDRGLVHGDFGTHNVAKFGDRWKILGIGGSIVAGQKTNPKRGFFHPPEAVVLETRNVSLGEKNVGAAVVSIDGTATYDIWAFGTIIYEALAGLPLSPYRSAYKAKRAMTTAELFKVGQWDDRSLRKALRHISDENAQDLIKKLLHPNPELRAQSMREALEHPYFGLQNLEECTPFVKPSAKTAEPVALKIYSDEYMTKMGWTDDDVNELFAPKEIYPADDFVIEEEEEDESPNPADEETPTEVKEVVSIDESTPSAEPQASTSDEIVSSVNSPVRYFNTDESGNKPVNKSESPVVAAAERTPANVTSPESPATPSATPAPKTHQPSTPAPPAPPMSTPQTAPTTKKSKFSVKGLKSKFGKK